MAAFFGEAAAYDQLMRRWSAALAQPFLGWLAAPPGADWLDVGCGTGTFTAAILERSRPAVVAGIDNAPALLARARVAVGSCATLVPADACALPFACDSFDVALAALVLNFVADPTRALLEMKRVTRRGGVLGAVVWDYPGGRSPVGMLRAALREAGVPLRPLPGSTGCTIAALRSQFERAGLRTVDAAAIDVQVAYSGFDEWWSALASPAGDTGRAVASLTPCARANVIAVLHSRVQSGLGGAITVSARAHAVKALV